MAHKRIDSRGVIGIVVAIAGAHCGVTAPPLPDLSSAPTAIRSHLQTERDAGIEGYCVALHADMFFDEAQRCYEMLERRDPSAWRWTYYRALILDENGGGQPSIDALRRVTSAAPEFGPAWLRLGEAEFKLSNYSAAVDAWRHAVNTREPDRGIETPPHVVDIPLAAYARLGLARVSLLEGNTSDAREQLEQAIALAPRFGPAYRLLGDKKADRLPAFAPYADPMVETLARTSRNATFLLRQASEADLAANAAWSEFLIRRALGFDPDNPDVLAKLGRLLRTLGRSDDALEFLRAYHDKVPGDFQGVAQLGSCLSDLKQYDDAERYLRQALEGLDDAQTHYNLGVVLASTNRVKEAIVEYQTALQRDPYLFDARNNLAAAYVREGRLADAAGELKRVLADDPSNPLARANLQRLAQADR